MVIKGNRVKGIKKLGLIIMITIIVIGIIGVSYGAWSQTLSVNGAVNTGNVDVQFQQAVTNDDGSSGNSSDPLSQGSWSWATGTTLSSSDWVDGTRDPRGYDNAITTITGGIGTATLNIAVTGGYPNYWSSVGCTIKNTGTIPLRIDTVTPVVTPPAGRSASDLTVTFSDALLVSSHTDVDPGAEIFGAVYIKWNGVPASDNQVYTLLVTIKCTQWNEVP